MSRAARGPGSKIGLMGGIECPANSTTISRISRATSAVLDIGNREVIPLTLMAYWTRGAGITMRHAAPFDIIFLVIDCKPMPPHQFQVTHEVGTRG